MTTAFFEWDDSYSVNVKEIDGQHRVLIQLINELHEVTTESHAQNTIASAVNELRTMGAVLDDLVDYAAHHFSTEEKCMLECGYPSCVQHEKAHRDFTGKIQTFKRELDEGDALSATEILTFLRDWWTRHILQVDKEYSPFLNEKGIT